MWSKAYTTFNKDNVVNTKHQFYRTDTANKWNIFYKEFLIGTKQIFKKNIGQNGKKELFSQHLNLSLPRYLYFSINIFARGLNSLVTCVATS